MPPIILAVASALTAIGVGAGVAIVAAVIITNVLIVGLVVGALYLAMKLLAPPNIASQQRLTATLNVNAPRLMIFGETAFGADERYWEVYGSNGYDQIFACATHKVTSFGTFYIQGVPVIFSGDTATGTGAVGTSGFPGYIAPTSNYGGGTLVKDNSLVGVHGTVFPGTGTTGAGALWTSGSYMTGLAGYRIKWTVTQKSLPGGVPTQIVQVGQGCPVYDPRRDSTVGGSGSHRANDNTTWQYTPTDSNGVCIGRNNALQMITYLLGWHITNPSTAAYVPVIGRCVNPNDINYASFIAAANTCESEGYYSDCVLSASDTHSNNEATIANGAQGYLLDPGGLWSYWVATDDTASIAVAFTADDIISGVSWTPKDTIANLYNQVGGNFVDPAITNLYQPYPYPDVVDATYLSQDGGIPKRLQLDFQNVQDPNLAQKLARIALNRNRVTGQFQATFNYKALAAEMMDCVTITFPNFGWTNKLFRVLGQAINPIGGIDLTLLEEYSAVYTGGTVNTYNPSQSGAVYDVNQAYPIAFTASGSETPLLLSVSWSAVDPNVSQIEIQFKGSLDAYFITAGYITNDGVTTGTLIYNIRDNDTYEIQARTISKNNVYGGWTTHFVTVGTPP